MKDTKQKFIDALRNVVANATLRKGNGSHVFSAEKIIGQIEFTVNHFTEILEREAIRESNDVLRSAHSIAERYGDATNWEAWINKLEKILDKQHRIMYPKQYKKERKVASQKPI